MRVNSLGKQGQCPFLPTFLLIILLLPLLILEWPTPAGQGEITPDLEAYSWVFLRQGQSLLPGEETVSVLAVGDVMLGRGVAAGSNPLVDVAAWLPAADLTIGNLEAVLADGGDPRRAPPGEAQPILLRALPASAGWLRQAGFDVLGLANNHSLDYGQQGLQETIGHLQQAGLESIGLIAEGGAWSPRFYDLNGVRLAFLACNAVSDPHPLQTCPPDGSCWPQPAGWDPVAAEAAIKSARASADAVIVSVHWGFENELWPDPFQEKAAGIMLEAGADLIIGHHPHVVQPIAVNGDRVTAYSLGNFVFDQGAQDNAQGLVLHAFFDRDGLRAVRALPIRAGIRPRPLSPGEGSSLLSRVLPPPPRLGFACDEAGCSPADAPQTDLVGRLYAGEVDLTGDGLSETVRLEGQRITIYEEGVAVWQSPAAWRVVDAALGDPNDDGRFEVMLAIWQRDEAGYERSHPYIVGYRGGAYRLLWGGRPVVDPIRELVVGDVDEDGSDELIVIEELADGTAQAISVWRWTGWTFSLVWRGRYGWYSDLILIDGSQTLISATLVSE